MATVNVLALHNEEGVTAALQQALACVDAANVPTGLRLIAFQLAFGALTARDVQVIDDAAIPQGIDGLLRPRG